jgi:TPR repeat protein
MKKHIIVLFLAIVTSSVSAQDDGEIFARGMELFNAKNYDIAAIEFLKIKQETAYYPSALYMAGACYNMKYSDVAMAKGGSMTKDEVRQGIADFENAQDYYEKSCKAGYQQGCTQAKIIKQVIVSLKNMLK